MGFRLFISANEGDSRDYAGFKEEFTLALSPATILDLTAFPNRDQLRLPANLGNLKLTNTLGDTDGDGDFDELYSFGGRSFSVWNGQTGQLVYDSRNELDKQAICMQIFMQIDAVMIKVQNRKGSPLVVWEIKHSFFLRWKEWMQLQYMMLPIR